MNTFENVLAEIFDRGAEARLDLAAETEAIEAAKRGEEGGVVALMYAYAPALRNVASTYRDALPQDDLRSTIVEGLLVAVKEYDPAKADRLAGVVSRVLNRVVSEGAMREAAFAIPERTLQRFYQALRAVDGDVEAALVEAKRIGMSREAFLGILAVLRETDSLEVSQDDGRGEFTGGGHEVEFRPLWDVPADAEDRVLVEIAFGAVDDLEADVVRVKYGFEGDATDRTLSDDATVHALSVRDLGDEAVFEGQTSISRQKVQRTHASALGKMREALGA